MPVTNRRRVDDVRMQQDVVDFVIHRMTRQVFDGWEPGTRANNQALFQRVGLHQILHESMERICPTVSERQLRRWVAGYKKNGGVTLAVKAQRDRLHKEAKRFYASKTFRGVWTDQTTSFLKEIVALV